MGYTNRDFRLVGYGRGKKAAKRTVRRLRRRADKRELNGEHQRTAGKATRRGWWHA